MRVRIDNDKEFLTDGTFGMNPLKSEVPVFVVTDPGKTNMAVIVGTVTGKILRLYEFSGKDMENAFYCAEFKRYLLAVLQDCAIEEFAQEQPILKMDNGKKDVKPEFKQFHSQMVLTEIRSHLRDLAIQMTTKLPHEINNMAWKKAILPDGYRSQSEKGSHRYQSDINPMFADYTHDATDAICMYNYMVNKYLEAHKMSCIKSEEATNKYSCVIISEKQLPANYRKFEFNQNFSVEDNAVYIANRFTGICISPLNLQMNISAEEYFKYTSGFLTLDSKDYLLVRT